jgi:hypothetical protein
VHHIVYVGMQRRFTAGMPEQDSLLRLESLLANKVDQASQCSARINRID